MREAANGHAAARSASGEMRPLRVHLELGDETIEVSIGPEGIRFRHPGSTSPEGVLGWEEAIALSVLPERARRLRSPTAA